MILAISLTSWDMGTCWRWLFEPRAKVRMCLRQSKIANVVRVGTLLREHAADLGDFMARDPRGQKLPLYIAQLAEHLANEQTTLSNELESIRKNIAEILVMQQNYAQLAGVAEASEGI
jgi:two-component system, NtrC family, sensor kinase